MHPPSLEAGFKYSEPAVSPNLERRRGGEGLTCARLHTSLAELMARAERTVTPAEIEACAENMLESGSGLIVFWHGPEALLHM